MSASHHADASRPAGQGGHLLLVAILLVAAGRDAVGRVLDRTLARQGFALAEQWVRRASVPDEPLRLEASGVAAVRLTLRSEGQTVGQSTAAVDAPANGEKTRNVAALLAEALRGAFHAASRTLEGPKSLERQAAGLQLGATFAKTPEPIRFDKLEALPRRLSVSRPTLAMRSGEQWAWVFPGDAIRRNAPLRSQLSRLLSSLDLPLQAWSRIGSEDGPELYRAEAIHLVRLSSRDEPVFLTRGDVTRPPAPVDGNRLATLQQRLVGHLRGRQRDDGDFAGTYHPSSGQYDPPTASTRDAAIACYALARAARVPGLSEGAAVETGTAARVGVDAVAAELGDGQAAAVAPLAAAVLAALETPGASNMKDTRDRWVRTLRAEQGDGGHFASADGRSALAARRVDALAAAALGRYYEKTRSEKALQAAVATLKALRSDLSGGRIVRCLPWLAIAEAHLTKRGHSTKWLPTLKKTAKRLWQRQVRPLEARRGDASPDTVGGFRRPWAEDPEPTWATARSLAALARLMGSGDFLAGADRTRWLVRAGLGARFIDQLTMRRPTVYYVRTPDAALGGTRKALWDNRLPLKTTAVALLAVAELRHTLADLAASQTAAK